MGLFSSLGGIIKTIAPIAVGALTGNPLLGAAVGGGLGATGGGGPLGALTGAAGGFGAGGGFSNFGNLFSGLGSGGDALIGSAGNDLLGSGAVDNSSLFGDAFNAANGGTDLTFLGNSLGTIGSDLSGAAGSAAGSSGNGILSAITKLLGGGGGGTSGTGGSTGSSTLGNIISLLNAGITGYQQLNGGQPNGAVTQQQIQDQLKSMQAKDLQRSQNYEKAFNSGPLQVTQASPPDYYKYGQGPAIRQVTYGAAQQPAGGSTDPNAAGGTGSPGGAAAGTGTPAAGAGNTAPGSLIGYTPDNTGIYKPSGNELRVTGVIKSNPSQTMGRNSGTATVGDKVTLSDGRTIVLTPQNMGNFNNLMPGSIFDANLNSIGGPVLNGPVNAMYNGGKNNPLEYYVPGYQQPAAATSSPSTAPGLVAATGGTNPIVSSGQALPPVGDPARIQYLVQHPNLTPQQISQMDGGLTHMATGGRAGALSGHTGGQDDKIHAMLSDGEFVIPADVVSHLGDGNNNYGASKLSDLIKSVRHKKGYANKLPPKSGPVSHYLSGGMA